MKDKNLPLPKEFMMFHETHPEVYRELRTMALQLHAVGHKHYGIKSLFEVMRWNKARVSFKDKLISQFKMNNNYTAFYARMLMEKEPALKGFFILRSSVADSLIKEVDLGHGRKYTIRDFG